VNKGNKKRKKALLLGNKVITTEKGTFPGGKGATKVNYVAARKSASFKRLTKPSHYKGRISIVEKTGREGTKNQKREEEGEKKQQGTSPRKQQT